jgi:hypothetical protein
MKTKSILVRDVLVFGGAVCLVYGAWRAWAPGGLMLAGILVAAFGQLWEIECQRRREIEERNRRTGI